MATPVGAYNIYEFSTKYRLVGAGNNQTTTGLLVQPPITRLTGAPSTDAAAPSSAKPGTVRLGSFGMAMFEIHNRSAVVTVAGIGVRVVNSQWIAGQWVQAAGTPFTDGTAAAQNATLDDFALETLTNNDGFVVASRVPFNAISLDISTASVTTAPVRTVEYLGSDQATWQVFGPTANLFVHDNAAAHYAVTGTDDSKETLIIWDVPPDWGKTPDAGLSGIPSGYYPVRIRSTTAPTGTAGKADSMSVYRLYFLTEALADNGVMFKDFGAHECLLGVDSWEPNSTPWADGLVCCNAFTYSTPGHGNSRVTALIRSAF